MNKSQRAKSLGITRQTLNAWSRDFPDCPQASAPEGVWLAFMRTHGLGKFSVRQNAPVPPPAASPKAEPNDERELRLRERRLRVEREEHELAKAKERTIPVVEVQAALRVTVEAFNTSLKALPGRAASKIVQRARAALLRMLKGSLTDKQFEKVEEIVQAAPIEFADVEEILIAETELVVRTLGSCDFLRDEAQMEVGGN